jgi:DNA-binding transcriptional regulator/RsmH inhibitor MraZ
LCSRLDTKTCLVRTRWDGPEDLPIPKDHPPATPAATKTHFPYVELIPLTAIEDFIEQETISPSGDRDSLWSMRDFSRPFREITIDSSNRLTLSPDLRFHLGLAPGDDVLIVGMSNHIDLWNNRDYDPAQENHLKDS